MKKTQQLSSRFTCPATLKEVIFEGEDGDSGERKNGFYVSGVNRYRVKDYLPDFRHPKNLPISDMQSLAWYKENAYVYDQYLPLTFETFGVDENVCREYLVDLLQIKPDQTILEFGCGTGRDSELIASRLNSHGQLYLQDISPEILEIAIEKFSKNKFKPEINFSLANGAYLPFKNNSFDSVFHFGGLNTFGDIKRAFAEMVRVVKPGGRIVVGDENMPIWLRETEFGKVLMNSNPHYRFELPLQYLPVEARNVKIEWIIGGVFYVISFDVGEGEPYANLDFEIPGPRGGTHRTRFYGNIEGVSPDTRKLAQIAREKSGLSMHRWLEKAIHKAAVDELGDEGV
jgi:ubiquinone/menaquinone biosynthesis C-methylase UbiE